MDKLLWVAGGRDYDNVSRMDSVLRSYADQGWTLITGAAPGADLTAERLWRDWQAPYIGVPARWNEYGRSAGPIRNGVVADWQPEKLVAFSGGRGTRNALDVAAEREIAWLTEL